MWRAWKLEPGAKFQARRLLLIWCGFVLLFFSASGSKLPSYILPLFPAGALLTGWRLASVPGTRLAWAIAPMSLLGLAGLLALPFIRTSGDTPVELIQAFKPWIAAAASVTLVGAALRRMGCAPRRRAARRARSRDWRVSSPRSSS